MNTVLMGIGEAARLVNRSVGTLRIWEREGLIRPRRATSGTRIFSQDDIDELKRIAESMENKRPRPRRLA
jgi:DNA-binding transcriptional MerR regulator